MPLSGAFALDFDGRHVLMRGREDAYLYTVGHAWDAYAFVCQCLCWSLVLFTAVRLGVPLPD